jgi:hypothetical protein
VSIALLARGGGERADAPPAATPAPPDTAWLARAHQHIAEREYWANASEGGLQAPNRAHDLRTWFEPDGIRVHDRTAAGAPQLVSLSLAAVGREGSLAAVTPGEVANDGPRVEIRRPGLTEWYENSPAGLEQGFTLAARPAGAGPLVLELGIGGARAEQQGDALVLRAGDRRLRYAKLLAFDATGAEVPARFALADASRLRILVEDAAATYPLVIDPLLTATADAQLEADEPAAAMGYSLASAGDVNGDGFADVIVGAFAFDAGGIDEGAAFVFHGGPGGVGSPADAVLQADQDYAYLGLSVASAGDVNGDGYGDVIVVASSYDDGNSDEGAAFVFHGGPSGVGNGDPSNADGVVEPNQDFGGFEDATSAGDVNGDGFGDVVVGIWTYDNGQANEGVALVLHGSGTGIGTRNPGNADALLESNQAGAAMGASVAAADVDGDGYSDVIVAASDYGSLEGAAFVYHGSGSGVGGGSPGNADGVIHTTQSNSRLTDVASAGDVNGDGFEDVIVASFGYNLGEAAEGIALVFHGGGGGLGNRNPGNADALFQTDQDFAGVGSVTGAGDVDADGYADVLIGSYLYDAGESNEGAVFLLLGGPGGVGNATPATADTTLDSDEITARLGFSVAGLGDVDGDGFSDVAAGAPFFGTPNEGAAFVYLGGNPGIVDGDPATAATGLESNVAGSAGDGWSAASAGDVNGDGYDDAIVAANQTIIGLGSVHVFHGTAAGIPDGDPTTATTTLTAPSLGVSAAGAGDVNGDGYDDVIVGGGGSFPSDVAFIFHGGPFGIPSGGTGVADAVLNGTTSAAFGFSVAGAGDVNGDMAARRASATATTPRRIPCSRIQPRPSSASMWPARET